MRLAPALRFAAPLALLALAGCGMPMQGIEAENRAFHWSGSVAACDDGGVLASIRSRFAHSQNQVGGQGLALEEISHIRQTGFRRNGPDIIPRRDCVATTTLSDTRRTAVYYTIVAGMGAYSLGDKVEFCVAGHDRFHLGDPACRRMSR